MSWGAVLGSRVDTQGRVGIAYSLWHLAWALTVIVGPVAGAPLAQATPDSPYVVLAALFLVTSAALRHRRRSGSPPALVKERQLGLAFAA
jgi:hypothetical protein